MILPANSAAPVRMTFLLKSKREEKQISHQVYIREKAGGNVRFFLHPEEEYAILHLLWLTVGTVPIRG